VLGVEFVVCTSCLQLTFHYSYTCWWCFALKLILITVCDLYYDHCLSHILHVVEYFSVDYCTFPSMHILFTLYNYNSHTVWDIYLIFLILVYRFTFIFMSQYLFWRIFGLLNEMNVFYMLSHLKWVILFPIGNALTVAFNALVVGVPRTSQGQPGTFNFMLRCS